MVCPDTQQKPTNRTATHANLMPPSFAKVFDGRKHRAARQGCPKPPDNHAPPAKSKGCLTDAAGTTALLCRWGSASLQIAPNGTPPGARQQAPAPYKYQLVEGLFFPDLHPRLWV